MMYIIAVIFFRHRECGSMAKSLKLISRTLFSSDFDADREELSVTCIKEYTIKEFRSEKKSERNF